MQAIDAYRELLKRMPDLSKLRGHPVAEAVELLPKRVELPANTTNFLRHVVDFQMETGNILPQIVVLRLVELEPVVDTGECRTRLVIHAHKLQRAAGLLHSGMRLAACPSGLWPGGLDLAPDARYHQIARRI